MTTAQRTARERIEKWCKRNGLKLTSRPTHVHPTSYVIGYAAPGCLIVSVPLTDSESHLRDMDRTAPMRTVRQFDKSLKAGDWCHFAYICRSGAQEFVAVPIP